VVPPLGFLKYLCKSKKGDKVDPERFNEALREAILTHETMNLEIPENEKKFKNPEDPNETSGDPYLIAGYGVNAFFSLMRSLMYLMIVISVFMLPVLHFYHDGDNEGIKNYSEGWKTKINSFSLGNLGGASTFCQQYKLKTETLVLKCPNGKNAVIEKDHTSH